VLKVLGDEALTGDAPQSVEDALVGHALLLELEQKAFLGRHDRVRNRRNLLYGILAIRKLLRC